MIQNEMSLKIDSLPFLILVEQSKTAEQLDGHRQIDQQSCVRLQEEGIRWGVCEQSAASMDPGLYGHKQSAEMEGKSSALCSCHRSSQGKPCTNFRRINLSSI